MKRITLRLPDDLHELVLRQAKIDSRSINEQIVHGLKRYILEVQRIEKADKALVEMESGDYYTLVHRRIWDDAMRVYQKAVDAGLADKLPKDSDVE